MLMLREPFNYTKWQQNLWPDKTVEEISKAANSTAKPRRIYHRIA